MKMKYKIYIKQLINNIKLPANEGENHTKTGPKEGQNGAIVAGIGKRHI